MTTRDVLLLSSAPRAGQSLGTTMPPSGVAPNWDAIERLRAAGLVCWINRAGSTSREVEFDYEGRDVIGLIVFAILAMGIDADTDEVPF
jgi:hypothetical protein